MRFLNNNRWQVTLILLITWLAKLFFHWELATFYQVIITLVATIIFDMGLTYFRKRIWFFSASTLVTGLLIGLIMDFKASFLAVILASLLAALSKQLLGAGNHRHIFNPAALGIVISSLVLNLPVAWSGVSWGIIPVLILIVGMTPILYKLNRLWQAIIFLLLYFAMLFILVGADAAFRLTIDGTVFLFALVMLTEPITSLIVGRWKYTWGLLTAGFLVLINLLKISFTDPLLLALLLSNIVGYFWVRKPRSNPQAVTFHKDAAIS